MIMETRTDRENGSDDLISIDDFRALFDRFWWDLNSECNDWMNARDLAKASKIDEEICSRFYEILNEHGIFDARDHFWYRISTDFVDFFEHVSYVMSTNGYLRPYDYDWIGVYINLDIPSIENAIDELGIKGEIVEIEILPSIIWKKFVPASKTDEIMMSLALP